MADELATASRAAGRATAVAWGTRVLWGGVFLSASGRCLSASASEAIALTALILAFIVAVAASWKKSADARTEPRSRALAAARRLERRFSERTSVLVAGVEFSNEIAAEDEKTTSVDLRVATVTLASRRLAAVASETDVADWRAMLTGENRELFRNSRKKIALCVLGGLADLALWGSAAVWGGNGEARSGTFPASEAKTGKIGDCVDKNKANKGNIADRKESENESDDKDGQNRRTLDEESDASANVDQPLENVDVLTALNVWIADLTQTAEIAEVLKAELENAGVAERTGANENGISDDATRFLLLARELNANLTRPKSGVWAQLQRLKATSRREWTLILQRRRGIGEVGGNGETEKIGGMENVGAEKNAVAGTEIALLLLAFRLKLFETKFSVAEMQDSAALGLSVVLRSDSATERATTLEAASRRAGEWATTLRREATAAQILRESWSFDATSQAWKAASETAWRRNQTLLARFAGRSTLGGATLGDDVAFEKAKERFDDAWEETRSLEKERFAIVARLLKRLQNEEAREFVESVVAEKGWAFAADFWGTSEEDAAAFDAINDAASRAEKRDFLVTEALKNNRFGAIAEELQTRARRLEFETSTIEKTAKANETTDERQEPENAGRLEEIAALNEADKELKERGENVDEVEKSRREESRFAFWAARLTFGVDEETSRKMLTQRLLEEGVKKDVGGGKDDASTRRVNEELRQGDLTSRQERELKSAPSNDLENDAASFEAAKGRNEEKEVAALDTVTDVETIVYDEAENAVKSEARRKENAAENVSRGEAESDVGEAAGAGGIGVGSENGDEAQLDKNEAFSGELAPEVRRRFEGTSAPKIMPEHAEKIRLYRRRIANERR